jgi:hypothetical protein
MLQYVKQIIVLGSVFLLFSSYSPDKGTSVRYNVTFGVKIGILPTGDLTQFAIMHYRNGRFVNTQPVSVQHLVNIGIGKWPIPSTTKRHNFFEEQGLLDLKVEGLPEGVEIDFTAAFDSLWKIRFDEHPFSPSKGKGWSNGQARPSLKQQEFIYNSYGVRGYDQAYFSDTSFFKLLRDVLDPNWIQHYKSL